MADELIRGAGLNFRFDPEAKALIASVEPMLASAPVDESWLRAHLVALGYDKLRYLPPAAMILLAKYNAGAPVAALRLAECVDATLELTISTDGLSALLTIVPAQGGTPVSKEDILRELATLGVLDGVDLVAINQAIADGAADSLVVAHGRSPVHGEDGWLEKLLPEVRDRAPRMDESGRIDYRDLGEIFVVHPGDRLMLRHPASDGVPGLSLLGQPIPARPGKDIMYAPNLTGVSCAPENPNLLLAAMAGQPVQVANGMIVEPVFSVTTVNTASGNIDFDGSVVIKDDIAAGMTVRASGDIEVGGMVEAATLEAGGSIVIKGGVVGSLGRPDAHEQTIRCAGSFSAAYLQQAKIEAGDSIFIDDTAMQCELIAVNHILVGNKRRGHIIGGRAQATLSIKGKVLGSPNRVTTRFEIGVDPTLHKQALEIAKNRDDRENQLLEISKLLDFASHHPERIKPGMVEKARASAHALNDDIAAMRAEEQALERKIELSQQSRVIAEEAIYEGVEVYLGKQRYRVAGEHGPAAVAMGKGGLGLRAIDEPAA
ncbi:MAG: FapA family protein [Rhodocyclaceae bacterium]